MSNENSYKSYLRCILPDTTRLGLGILEKEGPYGRAQLIERRFFDCDNIYCGSSTCLSCNYTLAAELEYDIPELFCDLREYHTIRFRPKNSSIKFSDLDPISLGSMLDCIRYDIRNMLPENCQFIGKLKPIITEREGHLATVDFVFDGFAFNTNRSEIYQQFNADPRRYNIYESTDFIVDCIDEIEDLHIEIEELFRYDFILCQKIFSSGDREPILRENSLDYDHFSKLEHNLRMELSLHKLESRIIDKGQILERLKFHNPKIARLLLGSVR